MVMRNGCKWKHLNTWSFAVVIWLSLSIDNIIYIVQCTLYIVYCTLYSELLTHSITNNMPFNVYYIDKEPLFVHLQITTWNIHSQFLLPTIQRISVSPSAPLALVCSAWPANLDLPWTRRTRYASVSSVIW